MDSQKMLGGNGCKLVKVGSPQTDGKFYAVVVNEDCVLSVLETVGGTNLIDEYGLAAATLTAGAFLPMFNGDPIKKVTTASGTAIAYGKNSD